MAFFANFCCIGSFLRRPAVDLEVSPNEKPVDGLFVPPNPPPIEATHSTTASEGKNSSYPIVDTAKVALSLLHASLDSMPVPGLKGIIGGILLIMDTFDKADKAKIVFDDLTHNITNLEKLLSKYQDPQEMPEDMENLLAALNKELQDVNAQIQQVVHRSRMRKIVTGADDAILVNRLIKKVDWAVANMMAGVSLNSANSVQRLEENGRKALLDKIVRSKNASWKHLDRPECLPGTRVSLLQQIVEWFSGTDSRQVFWLNGLAGTGKTTVARTIAELAAKQGILGASFFCSRDSSERNDHNLIFPTLAFQLAEGDSRLATKISDAVRDNLDISSMRPEEQLKTLILQPLQEQGSRRVPLLAVIDALDECRDPDAAERILLALSGNGAFSLPFFKVFVTSRPIPSARAAFRNDSLSSLSRVVVLHELDSHNVDEDIRLLINFRLQEGARQVDRFDVPPNWPPRLLVDKLVQKSASLFIFASTACLYITAPGGDLEERLEEIAHLPTTEYEGHLGIDALYKRVFEVAIERFPDSRTISRCCSIVGTIILLQNPVGIAALATIIHLRVPVVRSILSELRSLLIVPEEPDGVIRFFHVSLHDFLIDPQRCPQNLYINPSLQHQQIAVGLLKHMTRELKRNICQIDRFKLNKEVEDLDERLEKHIDRGLDYACRHWAYHLTMSPSAESTAELGELLTIFAKQKMLYWIETLSLLGVLPTAISALEDVTTWCSGGDLRVRELADLFRDAKRAVQHLAYGISECASQIYNALPFIPSKTLLRNAYMREEPKSIQVVSGMEERWSTCLRTIHNGHGVFLVAFSPDNTKIAGATMEQSLGVVKLWDKRTGEVVAQSDPDGSEWPDFAFLPNGWIIIGSSGGSLRIWDVETSTTTHSLRAHTNTIMGVSAPSVGHYMASASTEDVFIWNTSTWEPQKLEGAHRHLSVSCRDEIAALTNPPEDTVIGIWDLHTLELKRKLIGHTAGVRALQFSPDGRRLVSGGADANVRIWDAETGEQLMEHGELPGWVMSVAFSADGLHVAGSDNAVRIWETSSGQPQSILKGHQAHINSVQFSPDGMLVATGSMDGTVKIWDWRNATVEQDAGHSEWIQTIAISPDGKIFVTGSWDCTVAMWDSSNGQLIKLWKGHNRSILSVAFSPDGRYFASAGGEINVKLWNSVTGELEKTLHVPNHDETSAHRVAWSSALAFSADGLQLALETEYNLTIWDTTTGEGRVFWSYKEAHIRIYSLTFAPDGRRLAAGHENCIYQLDLDKYDANHDQDSDIDDDSDDDEATGDDEDADNDEDADDNKDADNEETNDGEDANKDDRDTDNDAGTDKNDDAEDDNDNDDNDNDNDDNDNDTDDDDTDDGDTDDDKYLHHFALDGIHRQIAYDDEGAYIISSAGVVSPRDGDSGPSKELPKCMKALHLFQGWLVDSEGNRRCWVPEAYRGWDVHASYGLTRVVLGGPNGRPVIVDLVQDN